MVDDEKSTLQFGGITRQHATRTAQIHLLWIRIGDKRWPLLEASYGDHYSRYGLYLTESGRFIVSAETFREHIRPAILFANPVPIPWSVEVISSDGHEETSDLLVGLTRFYQAPPTKSHEDIKTVFFLDFQQLYWGNERKTINDPPMAPIVEPTARQA